MNYEIYEKELLKLAKNAFEISSTLQESQRIEVYLDDGQAKISTKLGENDKITYTKNKILCYQVYGHNFLEQEIKIWIDYARVIQENKDDFMQKQTTSLEESIRESIHKLAKAQGVQEHIISAYEVLANLKVNIIENIEEEIIEYWWHAKEDENGKTLALAQIKKAIS